MTHRKTNPASSTRRARGTLAEHVGRDGKVYYYARFRLGGKRHSVPLGPISRAEAERELGFLMADVERGLWSPATKRPTPPPDEPHEEVDFHTFASAWFAEYAPTVLRSPRSEEDIRWALSCHLLPHFAHYPLSAITVAEVDAFRAAKVREGRLCARSINKVLARLGQVLDVADERDLIDRNPLRVNPRNRRLRADSTPGTFLRRADEIASLLAAAGELDAEARPDRRTICRRALLATLTYGGLRISECLDLRWRAVDLAGGRLRVATSKTAAGVREVDLLPALRDELLAWKAQTAHGAATDYVYPAAGGGRQQAGHVRSRILGRAVRRANLRREGDGLPPLPDRITPHSLRRSYASLLVALGENPRYVMGQIGHRSAVLTLSLYAQEMPREDSAALRALVGAQQAAVPGVAALGSLR